MPADLRDDYQAGDPLSHEWVNAVSRRLRVRPPRTGAGLASRVGPDGQVQLAAVAKAAFVGVANGNITARSGSTAGTGSVTRYELDPIAGTYASTSINYDVFNPSASTMSSGNGINSGQYCWVEEDDDGNLLVTPLECS